MMDIKSMDIRSHKFVISNGQVNWAEGPARFLSGPYHHWGLFQDLNADFDRSDTGYVALEDGIHPWANKTKDIYSHPNEVVTMSGDHLPIEVERQITEKYPDAVFVKGPYAKESSEISHQFVDTESDPGSTWSNMRQPVIYNSDSKTFYVGNKGHHHYNIQEANPDVSGAMGFIAHPEHTTEYNSSYTAGKPGFFWFYGYGHDPEANAYASAHLSPTGEVYRLGDLDNRLATAISIREMDYPAKAYDPWDVGLTRPFIYVPKRNIVYVGAPGTYHDKIFSQLAEEDNDIFDERQFAGRIGYGPAYPYPINWYGVPGDPTMKSELQTILAPYIYQDPEFAPKQSTVDLKHHHLDYESSDFDFGWENMRRPVVYHRPTRTFYIGNPGDHHSAVYQNSPFEMFDSTNEGYIVQPEHKNTMGYTQGKAGFFWLNPPRIIDADKLQAVHEYAAKNLSPTGEVWTNQWDPMGNINQVRLANSVYRLVPIPVGIVGDVARAPFLVDDLGETIYAAEGWSYHTNIYEWLAEQGEDLWDRTMTHGRYTQGSWDKVLGPDPKDPDAVTQMVVPFYQEQARKLATQSDDISPPEIEFVPTTDERHGAGWPIAYNKRTNKAFVGMSPTSHAELMNNVQDEEIWNTTNYPRINPEDGRLNDWNIDHGMPLEMLQALREQVPQKWQELGKPDSDPYTPIRTSAAPNVVWVDLEHWEDHGDEYGLPILYAIEASTYYVGGQYGHHSDLYDAVYAKLNKTIYDDEVKELRTPPEDPHLISEWRSYYGYWYVVPQEIRTEILNLMEQHGWARPNDPANRKESSYLDSALPSNLHWLDPEEDRDMNDYFYEAVDDRPAGVKFLLDPEGEDHYAWYSPAYEASPHHCEMIEYLVDKGIDAENHKSGYSFGPEEAYFPNQTQVRHYEPGEYDAMAKEQILDPLAKEGIWPQRKHAADFSVTEPEFHMIDTVSDEHGFGWPAVITPEKVLIGNSDCSHFSLCKQAGQALAGDPEWGVNLLWQDTTERIRIMPENQRINSQYIDWVKAQGVTDEIIQRIKDEVAKEWARQVSREYNQRGIEDGVEPSPSVPPHVASGPTMRYLYDPSTGKVAAGSSHTYRSHWQLAQANNMEDALYSESISGGWIMPANGVTKIYEEYNAEEPSDILRSTLLTLYKEGGGTTTLPPLSEYRGGRPAPKIAAGFSEADILPGFRKNQVVEADNGMVAGDDGIKVTPVETPDRNSGSYPVVWSEDTRELFVSTGQGYHSDLYENWPHDPGNWLYEGRFTMLGTISWYQLPPKNDEVAINQAAREYYGMPKKGFSEESLNDVYRWAWHPKTGLQVWPYKERTHAQYAKENGLEQPTGYAGGVLDGRTGELKAIDYHALSDDLKKGSEAAIKQAYPDAQYENVLNLYDDVYDKGGEIDPLTLQIKKKPWYKRLFSKIIDTGPYPYLNSIHTRIIGSWIFDPVSKKLWAGWESQGFSKYHPGLLEKMQDEDPDTDVFDRSDLVFGQVFRDPENNFYINTWSDGYPGMRSDDPDARSEAIEAVTQNLTNLKTSSEQGWTLLPVESEVEDTFRGENGYPVLVDDHNRQAYIGKLGSHHSDLHELLYHDYDGDYDYNHQEVNIWPPGSGYGTTWNAMPYWGQIDPDLKKQLEDWAEKNWGYDWEKYREYQSFHGYIGRTANNEGWQESHEYGIRVMTLPGGGQFPGHTAWIWSESNMTLYVAPERHHFNIFQQVDSMIQKEVPGASLDGEGIEEGDIQDGEIRYWNGAFDQPQVPINVEKILEQLGAQQYLDDLAKHSMEIPKIVRLDPEDYLFDPSKHWWSGLYDIDNNTIYYGPQAWHHSPLYEYFYQHGLNDTDASYIAWGDTEDYDAYGIADARKEMPQEIKKLNPYLTEGVKTAHPANPKCMFNDGKKAKNWRTVLTLGGVPIVMGVCNSHNQLSDEELLNQYNLSTPDHIAQQKIAYRWIKTQDGELYDDRDDPVEFHWELMDRHNVNPDDVIDLGSGGDSLQTYLDEFYRNEEKMRGLDYQRDKDGIPRRIASPEWDWVTAWVYSKEFGLITGYDYHYLIYQEMGEGGGYDAFGETSLAGWLFRNKEDKDYYAVLASVEYGGDPSLIDDAEEALKDRYGQNTIIGRPKPGMYQNNDPELPASEYYYSKTSSAKRTHKFLYDPQTKTGIGSFVGIDHDITKPDIDGLPSHGELAERVPNIDYERAVYGRGWDNKYFVHQWSDTTPDSLKETRQAYHNWLVSQGYEDPQLVDDYWGWKQAKTSATIKEIPSSDDHGNGHAFFYRPSDDTLYISSGEAYHYELYEEEPELDLDENDYLYSAGGDAGLAKGYLSGRVTSPHLFHCFEDLPSEIKPKLVHAFEQYFNDHSKIASSVKVVDVPIEESNAFGYVDKEILSFWYDEINRVVYIGSEGVHHADILEELENQGLVDWKTIDDWYQGLLYHGTDRVTWPGGSPDDSEEADEAVRQWDRQRVSRNLLGPTDQGRTFFCFAFINGKLYMDGNKYHYELIEEHPELAVYMDQSIPQVWGQITVRSDEDRKEYAQISLRSDMVYEFNHAEADPRLIEECMQKLANALGIPCVIVGQEGEWTPKTSAELLPVKHITLNVAYSNPLLDPPILEYNGVLYISNTPAGHYDLAEAAGIPYEEDAEIPSQAWLTDNGTRFNWYHISPRAYNTLRSEGYEPVKKRVNG